MESWIGKDLFCLLQCDKVSDGKLDRDGPVLNCSKISALHSINV